MSSIPKTQRAAVKVGEGEASKVEIKDVPVPELQPGQILVKIHWSGLCASDKSLIHDEWAAGGVKMLPATNGIAGHEGAGIVVAVADDMKGLWKEGDRAGIKWIASVCQSADCEMCSNGRDECHCPKQLNSGFSTAGTFQEYVATDARSVTYSFLFPCSQWSG
jgi:alcohol dehydrogenase, propanol-preferring